MGQAIEGSPVPEDFVFFLDIPATRQVLDVYDILVGDVVYLAELKKGESSGADRVTAVELKNTERNIITFGQIQESFDLRTHYASVTKSPVQDGLVEHDGEPERVVPGQDPLPGEPGFHSPPGLAGWYRIDPLQVSVSHLARVVPGLEQPGNDQGFPAQRGLRLGLQADQPGVVRRERWRVGLPPTPARRLLREREEFVRVMALDVVQVQQLPDLSVARDGVRVLDPGELGRRPAHPLGDLIAGHPGTLTQPT